MPDNVSVTPTPIQRNILDVAMELTQLYYNSHQTGSLEEMQETFSKFYAVAKVLDNTHHSYFKDVLPEEISKLIK